MKRFSWILVFLFAAVAVSCSSSDDDDSNGGGDGTGEAGSGGSGDGESGSGGSGDGGDDGCEVIVADEDCDQTQRPFVFVHGTFGSGIDFARVALLMGSNGFCQDRIVGVEYNSLGDDPAADGTIDAVIEAVLAETGFDQVDLAGHSQGTRHCGSYLAVPEQAAKVAHYINYSGSPDVGDTKTLSLSSEKDLNNTPRHATGSDVTAITFLDEDHFAVAAATSAFVETYRFLKGEEPEYTTVQCGQNPIEIEGIAESFADNVPITGRMEIRPLGDTPRDESAEPIHVPGTGDGRFGPIELRRNVAYEFKGFDENDQLVGHVYFPPFKRSNRLVRILAPSANPMIAGASTDLIVRGPGHTAVIARWMGGAFRHDLGASLKIDGVEVLTDENAGATAMQDPNLDGGVVGFFLSDYNTNGETDLGLYTSAPFLSYSDVFIDASEPAFIEMVFTAGSEDETVVDETLKISNWRSDSELTMIYFP